MTKAEEFLSDTVFPPCVKPSACRGFFRALSLILDMRSCYVRAVRPTVPHAKQMDAVINSNYDLYLHLG